jgi:hypothetical protein
MLTLSSARAGSPARIDNNAIADGFQIYLHSFVVTSTGEWAVVQQGLNDQNGMARRYHWHSASVRDFVHEPHTAIVGENQGTIMNLVDARADHAQSALLDIASEHPDKTLSEARYLRLPAHHEVRAKDVDLKRLGAVLAVAYERGLHDFAELLLLEKLGPRTLQSLALVAKWFTARRAVSTILRVLPSRMVARTVIRIPCR